MPDEISLNNDEQDSELLLEVHPIGHAFNCSKVGSLELEVFT